MSNGKSIPKKSSKPGSKTATSTTHPSFPIYVPSTAPSIEDWLTSLRQDSPASPTQSQGNAKVKQTSGTSGLIPRESSMRWDRDTSCWRTSQVSFMEMQDGLPMGERLLANFPRWGMTVGGELWEQEMLPHPISENDGGALGWPTPAARDWKDSPGQALEGTNPDGSKRTLLDQLPRLAQLSHPGPQDHQTETVGPESSPSDQTSPQPSPKRLSPNFVEWLMVIPIGWTDLKPLETASVRQWYENFSEGPDA